MDSFGRSQLIEIGGGLDRLIFPNVRNGGFVVPSELTALSTLGKEIKNEPAHQAPSAPRKQSTRNEAASPRGTWTPRQATPLLGAGLQARYEEELSSVDRAYPGLLYWQTQEGVWLLVKSQLVRGLERAANFLIGISYTDGVVRGWGYWIHPMSKPTWIGPRHTNFPDGSICAFDIGDETWVAGDSLVELVDLYSLWAVRHLHLEEFGRWPGPQVVIHPFERIQELKSDEYCGCGRFGKRYGDCCQRSDLSKNQIRLAVNFLTTFSGGGRRAPPAEISRFIQEQRIPPSISKLLRFGRPLGADVTESTS